MTTCRQSGGGDPPTHILRSHRDVQSVDGPERYLTSTTLEAATKIEIADTSSAAPLFLAPTIFSPIFETTKDVTGL